jgi:hypothetical protein
MSETTESRAQEQARAQLDTIVQMVKRLEHCHRCSGEDCELTDAEILQGIGIYYSEGMKASEEDRQEYHNEEAVRETIEEDPLSVEVRSGWVNSPAEMKAEKYQILLCTGGPAVRIIGELDIWGNPYTARLEYQDWGTPWVQYLDMTPSEYEALLTYARQFYFGT